MDIEFCISTTQLKPCKHCGRVPSLREVAVDTKQSPYNRGTTLYRVKCLCGIQTKDYKSKSGVIKCWNRVPKEG